MIKEFIELGCITTAQLQLVIMSMFLYGTY